MAESLEINVKCVCGKELDIEKVELDFDTNVEIEIKPCQDCIEAERAEAYVEGERNSE